MSDPAQFNMSQVMDYVRKQFEEMRNAQAPPVPPKNDKEETTDALGQRDVVQQAQRETTSTRKPGPGPSSQPQVPIPFSHTEQSVKNAIRLSIGSNFRFTPRPQFGLNTYLPSFWHTHAILDQLNKAVFSVRKFYEASEFLDPSLVHIYIQIIEIVVCLRAQREASSVNNEVELFLSFFEDTFPDETLAIPGPITSALSLLSASSPAIGSYNNICPLLPASPNTTTRCLGVPSSNIVVGATNSFSGRVCPVPALLDVFRRRIQLAITQQTVQNGSMALGNFNMFARTALGTTILTGADGAFTSPFQQHNLNAGSWPITGVLLGSPGFISPPWMSASAANSLLINAPYAEAIFGAPVATRNNDLMSWRQWCNLDGDTTWFTETARLMSTYCRFVKGSEPLASISPSGNMGNHIRWSRSGGTFAVPTRRFDAARTMPVRGEMYNLGIPEADAADSAVYAQNIDIFMTTLPTNDPRPRSGPYFTNLPVLAATGAVDSLNGTGAIINDVYVSAVPLK